MAYGNFRAFGNNRGGRAPSPGSIRDIQRRNAIKNGGRHPLISNRGFVTPPTFWWTGTEYDETYTQLENVSAIETTFNLVLTTNPTLSAPSNGAFNQGGALPYGKSYPDWQDKFFTNVENITVDSTFNWNDFAAIVGEPYQSNLSLAITVSSPKGNLAIGHQTALDRQGNLTLYLKRGRKYRFDLSSPSLSVNKFYPYQLINPMLDNNAITNISEVSTYYDEPVENKFMVFENDLTFTFDYDENNYIKFFNSDRFYITDEGMQRINSIPYRNPQNSTINTNNPSGLRKYGDGTFDLWTFCGDNYHIMTAPIDRVSELYRNNKFIDDGSIVYNGIPGTPGAYMDITIHDGYPKTFTIFNSAYPQNLSNESLTGAAAASPSVDFPPNALLAEKNRINNNKQYVTRSDFIHLNDLSTHGNQSVDEGYKYGPGINGTNNRIIIRTFDNNDIKIAGDYRPKNNKDKFESLHTILSTNYQGLSCTLAETFRTPVTNTTKNLSAPGYMLDKFILCDKWKDTRTRTITALTHKVLMKINNNNPKNTIITLSSFNLGTGRSFSDTLLGGATDVSENFGAFKYGTDETYTQLSYDLFSDYQRPIVRTGPAGPASHWNTNWWGYNSKDYVDFSGLTWRISGYTNGNYGILLTPKHMVLGGHWSSKPRLGDVAQFLEKNTNKLVSAKIIQIVALKNNFDYNQSNSYQSILSSNSVLSGVNGNSDLLKNGAFTDTLLCKLDRDVTTPDPEVEGSDGSIRPYKIPEFHEPLWWNDLEDMYPKNVPHRLSAHPSYSFSYRSSYRTTDLRWQLSGGGALGSLPVIDFFGLGHYGGLASGSRYGSGFEHTIMRLQPLELDVYKYDKNVSYGSDLITNFPAGSGVIYGIMSGPSVFNQSDTSVNDFQILSSNPYLEFESDNLYNIPLKIDDDEARNIAGDSNNPLFFLVETSTDELQPVPFYAKSSSSFYSNSNTNGPLSADVKFIFNSLLDGMVGGNPEGYTLSSIRIT